MSFNEILLKEKMVIEEKIRVFFNHLLQPGAFNNQFLYQYYADLLNYMSYGGKRLRPVSLIMMYKGLGGTSESIYDLALSVEILHNASLVHDDIIDHDVVRRGNPSFHAFYADWFGKNMKKNSEKADFGLAMGILGGDLLVELGGEAIIKASFEQNKKWKALTYYLSAYKELIDGVIAESYLQNLPLEKVSEEDYLSMIKGKTSALFEKCILIGAVLADETEKYKKELSQFAILLGQAFQIRDDILGVFGDPKETGKSTESDIREGKKTLLAINGNKNPKLVALYGKKNLTNKEIQTVKQLLRESGALEQTNKRAFESAEKAKEILENIRLEKQSANFFKELANFVQERIT